MLSLPIILSEVLHSCPEWTVSGRRCPLCLQSHLATVRPSKWIASLPLVLSGSSWPDSSPGGINWRMSDFEMNQRTALGCWIWPVAVLVRVGGQELLPLLAVSQKLSGMAAGRLICVACADPPIHGGPWGLWVQSLTRQCPPTYLFLDLLRNIYWPLGLSLDTSLCPEAYSSSTSAYLRDGRAFTSWCWYTMMMMGISPSFGQRRWYSGKEILRFFFFWLRSRTVEEKHPELALDF